MKKEQKTRVKILIFIVSLFYCYSLAIAGPLKKTIKKVNEIVGEDRLEPYLLRHTDSTNYLDWKIKRIVNDLKFKFSVSEKVNALFEIADERCKEEADCDIWQFHENESKDSKFERKNIYLTPANGVEEIAEKECELLGFEYVEDKLENTPPSYYPYLNYDDELSEKENGIYYNKFEEIYENQKKIQDCIRIAKKKLESRFTINSMLRDVKSSGLFSYDKATKNLLHFTLLHPLNKTKFNDQYHLLSLLQAHQTKHSLENKVRRFIAKKRLNNEMKKWKYYNNDVEKDNIEARICSRPTRLANFAITASKIIDRIKFPVIYPVQMIKKDIETTAKLMVLPILNITTQMNKKMQKRKVDHLFGK